MGEPAEPAAGNDDPAAETDDAAVEAALREMFLVPAAEPAAPEPEVALTSWWYRLPRML